MSAAPDPSLKELTVALPDLPWPLLQSVAALADAPLAQIAERLRDATLPYMGSSALVIFTEDCTGRPQKKAGDEDLISRGPITELDPLRATLNDEGPWFGATARAGTTSPEPPPNHARSNAPTPLPRNSPLPEGGGLSQELRPFSED